MARGPLIERIVYFLPTPLLVNPERVVLKSLVAICGLGAIVFAQPTSLNALLPGWAVDVWGVLWLVGGVCGLLGYWLRRRWLERAGHWAIIAGAVEFDISLAAIIGHTAFVSMLLVFGVALCSAIRLLVAAVAKRIRRKEAR